MGKYVDRSSSWLVTYSDFITLLLVFFVVFYAITPGVEESKLKAIQSAFDGGEGILNESSVIPIDALAEKMKRSERWEALNTYIAENNLGDQVQIDLMETGNRIILKESLTFLSGDFNLLDKSKNILREITYLFDETIAEVEVQGHTDNIPVRSSRYRSNWDLGAERSISVLLFLLENTNLPPEKFKASSLGEYQPIADNADASGRGLNRRVEILIRYNQTEEPQGQPQLPGFPATQDIN
ncbi:hypothetical protein EP331_03770 [bacterium]|nr:MAG: hypothetical protein EP331_03770 [bacterium]